MSVTVERALTRDQLERVRGSLAAKGFTLTGDVGTFSVPGTAAGDVAGSFRYAEGKLLVDVTKHRFGMGRFVKSTIEGGIEEAVRS